MELSIVTASGHTIAAPLTDEVVITTAQDALDLMATTQHQGANVVMLSEKNITPDFFDLKTGIAGEILQKYSNYQMKLVIIGDFDRFNSQSLRAFMLESNRGNLIAFVATKQDALDHLSDQH